MKSWCLFQRLGVLLFLGFLFPQAATAQDIIPRWINQTGSTVPVTVIQAGSDVNTNFDVLGWYYGATNKVGGTTLTNLLSTSNLFICQFHAITTNAPFWAKTVVTEYPVSNARIINDFSGNIFVAGSYGGTNLSIPITVITNFGGAGSHPEDVFLAKFSVNGNLSWLRHIGGTAGDSLGDLVMEPLQSPTGFYVTGTFQSTNFMAGTSNLFRPDTNSADCFTAKFDLNGNVLWLSQGTYATGDCLAVDTAKNCYVAGRVLGASVFGNVSVANQTTSSFVVKYDAAGAPVWARGDLTIGSRIGVDKAQSLYTAGTFSNALTIAGKTLVSGAPSTIFVAKYDSDGNPLWAQSLPGLGNDGFSSLMIDRYTNCWVTGYFAATNQAGSPVNPTAVAACYDPAGQQILLYRSPMPSSVAGGVTSDIFNANLFLYGTYATNFSINAKYALTNAGSTDIFGSIVRLGPKVSLVATSTNIVLSWPALVENTGFVLQSSTNFGSTNWTTVGTGTTVGGQKVVTNTLSGPVQFYRLFHP